MTFFLCQKMMGQSNYLEKIVDVGMMTIIIVRDMAIEVRGVC